MKNFNLFRSQLNKYKVAVQIWSGKKNLIIFVDMEANPLFLYRYEVKEVFSIECWNKKKKSNSFLTNYTNCHLADSVMRKEENRPMIAKMYRSICIDNGKE